MDTRRDRVSSFGRIKWFLVIIGACLLLAIFAQANTASPQTEELIGKKSDRRLPLSQNAPESPDGLPDLLVTDFWANDEGSVCFQLKNAGDEISPTPHTSGLWVDGLPVATSEFEITIDPGKRASACFSYDWVCTPTEDELQVCADIDDEIDEGDEGNNCRSETWSCDQTAPLITYGPTATEITSTTVKISWTTDEATDGRVEYDTSLDTFALFTYSDKLYLDHEVILYFLQPATLYQFRVKSADASGNLVQSKPTFFETLSEPDSEPPTIGSIERIRNDTEWLQYFLEQEVSDNQEVERVEFYLDSTLVGTDYSNVDSSGGTFTANVLPGLLGIGRTAFFGPHTVNTNAYDRFGLFNADYAYFEPAPEPMRGDLDILSPEPEKILYVMGYFAPPGTTVPITATAVVYDEECHPAFTRDNRLRAPYVCSNVEHAVQRIVFSVAPPGGSYQTKCTVYPSFDTDRIFRCNWDASNSTWGTYNIRVQSYANDGSMLEDTRGFVILQGSARLEAQRQVTRINNTFRVRLIFHNRGTFPLELDQLQDFITGFQPIEIAAGTTYNSTFYYAGMGVEGTLDVDLFSPGSTVYTLNPGESFTVEYMAIPILYPELDMRIYAIGQRPIQVLYWLSGLRNIVSYNLRSGQTDTGQMLGEAVQAARRASDYLIVTHPERLFHALPDPTNVNALLSTLAELAQLKKGILGYLSDGSSPVVKSTYLRWGEEMQGSDGIARNFRNNGYLLLVGESEIIGSWTTVFRHLIGHDDWIWFSDNPYANTDNDESYRPEVIIGRVIGDDATELRNSIKNSVEVAKGLPNAIFDRTNALIVAGNGDGENTFEADIDSLGHTLGSEFTLSSFKVRLIEAGGWNMKQVFADNALDKDLIVYRDHCDGNWWADTVSDFQFDYGVPNHPLVQLGSHRPFVFGCCCQAGRYENVGTRGIAEEFLQHGAGAYIGATENSDRSTNSRYLYGMMNRYANHTNMTAGRILRDQKRDFFLSMVWNAEYNLYGDPKFGATTSLLAAELAPKPLLPSTPLASTIEVTVTDYVIITTTNGVSLVTIPGWGYLQELGKPMVPIYQESYQLADGDWVQEVTLTGQFNDQWEEDLNLKIAEEEWDCDSPVLKVKAPSAVDALEEWPEKSFDWRVEVGTDGNRYLMLTLYPFTYYPLTAEGRFYKNFEFEVTTSSSPIELSFFGADQPFYDAGDSVLLEYWLDNPGSPQDVVVATVVRSASSGEIVDGLPMRRLNNLGMRGTFAQRWDTTSQAPGDYIFEAQVRDLDGAILDTKREQISIGKMEAELSSLVVAPTIFSLGDQVSIDFNVSNPGTVPLTGTVVVELRSAADGSLVDFSQPVDGLTPSGLEPVHFDWDTTSATVGVYKLAAYLLFDSRTTDPLVANLSTPILYLPVVRK